MENLKSQIKFIQEIEAEEIIKEAEEQAKKIVKEASEKAEKVKDQKMREVSEKLHEREASELAMTKLGGRKKILNVKSQLVEEALAKTIEKLKEIGSSGKPMYKDSLERLVIEALTKLKGTEFRILTNSRDKKFIKESLSELEKKISKSKGASISLQVSEETQNTLGGVIVQTKDKKQIFNNTLEARLARVRQEMVGKIFDSLFEGAKD